MSKRKKILLISISVIICIIAVSVLYVYNSYEKIRVDEGNKKEDRREASKYKEVKGISNILLIGIDASVDGEPTRSDALTILTIDDNHKKIKLTSILRDAYVKIPGHSQEKITHAYSYGEISLLRKTIEENFNVRLDNYAIIDFKGFTSMIDVVGGVEVEVKNRAEVKELNRCTIKENGNKFIPIKKPGKQLLNGRQALAFSRMREVGNGTYDRARRQREVLEVLIKKFKDVSAIKYPSIANELLPYIKTNIPLTDALNFAYTIQKIGNFDIDKLQIPTDKLSDGLIVSKAKGWVHVMNLEDNKKVMHDFIFEDKPYDEKLYTQFKYAGNVYTRTENSKDHEYNKPKTKKNIYTEKSSGSGKSQNNSSDKLENNSNNHNSNGGSSNVTNKTETKTETKETEKTEKTETKETKETEKTKETQKTKENTDAEQKKEETSIDSTKK